MSGAELRKSRRKTPDEPADLFGLNLTATTLAAILKYPWDTGVSASGKKKAGYLKSEESTMAAVHGILGLRQGIRHPLVYLMEAADDIAYCISDVEDG